MSSEELEQRLTLDDATCSMVSSAECGEPTEPEPMWITGAATSCPEPDEIVRTCGVDEDAMV
jgi:hypothetical protein